MVEKSGVEKFLLALGLKSSRLKSPGLKGLELKLGVEKSGVEMSFNFSDGSGLFLGRNEARRKSIVPIDSCCQVLPSQTLLHSMHCGTAGGA